MTTGPTRPPARGARFGGRSAAAVALLLPLLALTTGGPSAASGATAPAAKCSRIRGISCVLGIPYLTGRNSSETLDVYYPTTLTDRASIVVIHGGIWKQGSSRSFAPEAEYFAENGFAVFAVNYTLARRGNPSWPQVRDDVEGATAWVTSHADQYHGDGSRVGVLGGSSGGHLAALVDTDGPEHGVHPLAAVSWSGAMDLSIVSRQGNKTARNGIDQLLGCRLSECPQTYADASPVTHVASGDGSLLFFNSQDERIPLAAAREMNQALASADVPHTLVVFKNSSKHARQYECDPANIAGERLAVIDASLRWLGTQLGQPTVPTGTFCSN